MWVLPVREHRVRENPSRNVISGQRRICSDSGAVAGKYGSTDKYRPQYAHSGELAFRQQRLPAVKPPDDQAAGIGSYYRRLAKREGRAGCHSSVKIGQKRAVAAGVVGVGVEKAEDGADSWS